jgi:hypothetical protein
LNSLCNLATGLHGLKPCKEEEEEEEEEEDDVTFRINSVSMDQFVVRTVRPKYWCGEIFGRMISEARD